MRSIASILVLNDDSDDSLDVTISDEYRFAFGRKTLESMVNVMAAVHDDDIGLCRPANEMNLDECCLCSLVRPIYLINGSNVGKYRSLQFHGHKT